MNIDTLTHEQFAQLPLVVEGESKEVRYAGNGQVVIRFKPTIYSFTAHRAGVVEGSDTLRLRATKIFVDILKQSGIKHAYREINDTWVLADLVLQPETSGGLPFRPTDLSLEELAQLPVAAPIEVIIKRTHSGTSKYRYFDMSTYRVRKSHSFFANMEIENEGPYPEAFVRFDWRNPLQDRDGKYLADEILPDALANLFINTQKAAITALHVYDVLSDFLGPKNIICYDLCLFIAEDGELVFGEISQDCGRFRHFDLGSLDKDIWRLGGSSEIVCQKWQLLLDTIGYV